MFIFANKLLIMGNWIDEHPFTLVFIIVCVFMGFIFKEDMRAVKHQKHIKEIERRKKNKL